MLDLALDFLDAHLAVFAAALVWLTTLGLFAMLRQAERRGYVQTQPHGIVHASDQPSLFRSHQRSVLALALLTLLAALMMTVVAVDSEFFS